MMPGFKYAGACYQGHTPEEFKPFLVAPCDSKLFVGLALGSETGWDNSYEASKTVLDTLWNDLCQANQPAASAIPHAFIAADQQLNLKYPSDDLGAASSTILCALVDDDSVDIGWLGGEEAYLIRSGQISARTIGHTVRNLRPELELAEHFAWTITQYLGRGNSTPEMLAPPWKLLAEDKLVFVTRDIPRYIDMQQFPRLVTRMAPQQASRLLVEMACQAGGGWGCAAVVVEVG